MLPVSLAMLLMTLLLVSMRSQRRRGARVPAHAGPTSAAHPAAARHRCGVSGSGPELALELRGRLLERARVGAGGQVLPPAVADDEADVGPPARRDLLVGDAARRVQDRAGRDAGEDAL